RIGKLEIRPRLELLQERAERVCLVGIDGRRGKLSLRRQSRQVRERRLCPCWRRRSCARARLAQELLRRGRVSTQARARARGATVGYVAERRHRRQRIERRAGSRLPSPATCDGQRAREIEPDV